ncbi:MAG: helix-turn-helix transcriptional regulator [Bacteroidales bacterium]|nr:helix-turn-helix transcriptional regulator [Bacteroidales bacterium]
MKEVQFSAMMMMSLLTVTLLVLLPQRVDTDGVTRRSRWMMAGGCALLAVQFLLQYVIGFRQMGVTQAVMVNLFFFIPTSWLMSVSVLNLQKEGQLTRHDWLPGVVTWTLTMALVLAAAIADRRPLLADTHEIRMAEYLGCGAYSLMQIYYSVLLFRGNRRLKRALSNYFDHDTDDLLQWMERSVVLLALIAIGVPLLIFSSGWWLRVYALLIFCCLYYLLFSFICYCVSNDQHKVTVAQQNAQEAGIGNDEKTESDLSDDDLQRVELAAQRWMSTEAYLRSGLTMPAAAAEMHVPQKLFRAWYQTKGFDSYSDWLQNLRIEHAKFLMKEHPDWSFDTIAENCGFSSRPYFHKVFSRLTGTTPQRYVDSLSAEPSH